MCNIHKEKWAIRDKMFHGEKFTVSNINCIVKNLSANMFNTTLADYLLGFDMDSTDTKSVIYKIIHDYGYVLEGSSNSKIEHVMLLASKAFDRFPDYIIWLNDFLNFIEFNYHLDEFIVEGAITRFLKDVPVDIDNIIDGYVDDLKSVINTFRRMFTTTHNIDFNEYLFNSLNDYNPELLLWLLNNSYMKTFLLSELYDGGKLNLDKDTIILLHSLGFIV